MDFQTDDRLEFHGFSFLGTTKFIIDAQRREAAKNSRP
jgi:hypothetical protein